MTDPLNQFRIHRDASVDIVADGELYSIAPISCDVARRRHCSLAHLRHVHFLGVLYTAKASAIADRPRDFDSLRDCVLRSPRVKINGWDQAARSRKSHLSAWRNVLVLRTIPGST